jgi:catechol 2,3-dioxygenase-like lactoylglutathione lyase family enzyme
MLSDAPVTATLVSTDLKRTRAFYEGMLGLKVNAAMTSDDGVLYDAGKGTNLYLYVRQAPKADNTVANFTVANIEQEVNDLTAKGVKFEQYAMPNGIKTDAKGIAVMGSLKSAWFKDPDGNILSLLQVA